MKSLILTEIAIVLLVGLGIFYGPELGQAVRGSNRILGSRPGSNDTLAQVQQAGSSRTELQRHDFGVPGREVIQVRVDFDPGYTSPRHTHPGEEIIYVIEGTLEYEIGGQPIQRVRAGDVLFVPAGVVHLGRNVGRSNGAELATYVVEKGEPLITLIP